MHDSAAVMFDQVGYGVVGVTDFHSSVVIKQQYGQEKGVSASVSMPDLH